MSRVTKVGLDGDCRQHSSDVLVMANQPEPVRPWPQVDDLSCAVELLHALVIWETYSDAGDRPTFVEVGGIDLWGRCDELTAERSASAVLVEQLAIVRALVVETVDNYDAVVTSLEKGLADRCSHDYLRPLIRGLFEGPR